MRRGTAAALCDARAGAPRRLVTQALRLSAVGACLHSARAARLRVWPRFPAVSYPSFLSPASRPPEGTALRVRPPTCACALVRRRSFSRRFAALCRRAATGRRPVVSGQLGPFRQLELRTERSRSSVVNELEGRRPEWAGRAVFCPVDGTGRRLASGRRHGLVLPAAPPASPGRAASEEPIVHDMYIFVPDAKYWHLQQLSASALSSCALCCVLSDPA